MFEIGKRGFGLPDPVGIGTLPTSTASEGAVGGIDRVVSIIEVKEGVCEA